MANFADSNEIHNILFKNVKNLKLNFFEKNLVLLENKFNENCFTFKKTWKTRKNLANGNDNYNLDFLNLFLITRE